VQILRVPPYNNIVVQYYTVPLTWPNNKDIRVRITDLADSSKQILVYPSPVTPGQVLDNYSHKFSGKYDNNYKIEVFQHELDSVLLYEEYYEVIRPYIDPNTLGETASEINEYKNYELIARSLIDTYIKDGFYNKKIIINTSGNGSDYFPVWHNANKILKVYENNLLVYDCDNEEDYEVEYRLLADKSAIYKIDVATASERRNRMEHDITKIATAHGDLGHVAYVPTDFPKGVDYDFVLGVGYLNVPSDVEIAAKMLIDDIKCGKLDYYKRYISAYNTDQFRIQFDKGIVYGTGNLLVDKILEKYITSITKPGVL